MCFLSGTHWYHLKNVALSICECAIVLLAHGSFKRHR